MQTHATSVARVSVSAQEGMICAMRDWSESVAHQGHPLCIGPDSGKVDPPKAVGPDLAIRPVLRWRLGGGSRSAPWEEHPDGAAVPSFRKIFLEAQYVAGEPAGVGPSVEHPAGRFCGSWRDLVATFHG